MSTLNSIRLASICSSDRRMDILDVNQMLDTPVNKYEIKCDACSFPDIDKVPNPYYLAKNRIFSGIEIMEAHLGNLFVSDRVKQIFELLFPEVCSYQKTYVENSKTGTRWWLAIPNHHTISGSVMDTIPVCDKCKEPLHAHPGTQYKFWLEDILGEHDVIKSTNWYSLDEEDWKQGMIGRNIFLSVRLISLLKKIGAKGIDRYAFSEFKVLSKAEKQWVEDAIESIGELAVNNERKDFSGDELKKMMELLNVEKIDSESIAFFEKKYKSKSTDIISILCSVKDTTPLSFDGKEDYTIESIKYWERGTGSKKLISFAFDIYGNSLQFDPKDKLCPVYFYDHETMMAELIYSSVLDLIK